MNIDRDRATWKTYLPHARLVLESNLIAKDDVSRIDRMEECIVLL